MINDDLWIAEVAHRMLTILATIFRLFANLGGRLIEDKIT